MSLRCLLPENSTDERVFSPLVGIWKVRKVVFDPSLRSGVVELWAWSVRLQVSRVRKRFIMPLIEGWRVLKRILSSFIEKMCGLLKIFRFEPSGKALEIRLTLSGVVGFGRRRI